MATDVLFPKDHPKTDVTPRPRSQQCPRPRETKLLQAIVEGKSVNQALIESGFHPKSNQLRARLKPGGDLREELDKALEAAGITLPRTLQRLSDKLDATKTVVLDKVPTNVDDNDAQLRAIEQTLKLHERAGRIPSAEQGGTTVKIVVNVQRERLESHISQVIDITPVSENG